MIRLALAVPAWPRRKITKDRRYAEHAGNLPARLVCGRGDADEPNPHMPSIQGRFTGRGIGIMTRCTWWKRRAAWRST